MNDGFGIAARPEMVPPGLEFASKLAKVVNLSVEDDPDGFVLVRDRLGPALDVDDRKAPHREPNATVFQMKASAVGPSMGNRVVHGLEQVAVDRPGFAKGVDADNPTHVVARPPPPPIGRPLEYPDPFSWQRADQGKFGEAAENPPLLWLTSIKKPPS